MWKSIKALNSLSKDYRKGAAAILLLAMIGAFMVSAGVTVDYAYMQLVRTELRTATDAAAKAGAEALARTENEETAISAAIEAAARNRVGGKPVLLDKTDVEFGRSTASNSGKWQFVPGATPYNSMRVDAKANEINLFFANLLGTKTFSAEYHAVAGQQEVDVCICLDRSGSMLFDMSGTGFVYPPNNPRLSTFTAWGTMWQNHLSPPHPTASRWAVLARAVNDFYAEVAQFNPTPSTALVTWGSDYTMPIAPSTFFPASRLDVRFSTTNTFENQRRAVTDRISQYGRQPMMGGTNLSAGLDMAINEIRGAHTRSLANKVIILFTDGEWNDGRLPSLAANDAKKAGITVHTVSMLTSEQRDLLEVAQITGGMSFTTQNEAQLRDAFKEIARSLQVVMIE